MDYTNIARGKRKDNPSEWVYGYYYCIFVNEDDGYKEVSDRGLSFPECREFHHYIIPLNALCSKVGTIEDVQVEIFPETYGQCSEFSDITNDRMAFTGDIVKIGVAGEDNVLCVVSFGECGGIQNVNTQVGYMGFYLEPGNEASKKMMDYGMRNDPLYFYGVRELEVIGNIHDDPGLLKS